MLTRTSEYALRAMIVLARHPGGGPLTGEQLAKTSGIPRKYLVKIMGDLTRAGALSATRGRSGGFTLSRPADRIHLIEVIAPFERFDDRRCPFGNERCGDRNPCGGHERWKTVAEAYRRFLEETTVFDISRPVSKKKESSPVAITIKRPK
jgi:Rrf2 family protein